MDGGKNTEVQNTESEVLGERKKEKTNDWYSVQIEMTVKERTNARDRIIQRATRANVTEHRDNKRIVKMLCRRKVQDW